MKEKSDLAYFPATSPSRPSARSRRNDGSSGMTI
jgi:hypothetical protein